MALSFLFGGNTGETPETLKRKRELAMAIMGAQDSPKTVGEGLNALGAGITAGIMNRRADKAESEGRASADALFNSGLKGQLAGKIAGTTPSVTPGGGQGSVATGNQNVGSTIDFARGEASGGGQDVAALESYIRDAATKRGIDPDIAVRVARSEGLGPGIWQSNYVKNGKRETSYGPFQLLVGGGLGDKFQKLYGKSPEDPSTVYNQVDFALDEAAQGGWSPWYGAAKVGVGDRTGLENARAVGYQPQSREVASLDPSIGMPAAASEMAATSPQPQPPAGNIDPMVSAPNYDPVAANQPVVQPQPAPQQVAQAQPQDQPDPATLYQIIAHPFASPEQKAVAKMMLEQQTQAAEAQRQSLAQRQQAEYEAYLKQNDPQYRANLAKTQQEAENLKTPEYQTLTPEERKALGIPDTDQRIYQRARGGKLDAVGGAGQTINVGNEVEARKAAAQEIGLDPTDPRYETFVLTGKMPREDAQALTATDKKAILEADEMVSVNENAIKALTDAKGLSDTANSGWFAGTRATMGNNLPDWMVPDAISSPESSQATANYDNAVVGQALSQLKAIFGGAPTEGERKILLDLQGSSSMPKNVRDQILDRAIEMANRRLEFNRQRADSLRGGEFYKPGGGKKSTTVGGYTIEEE